MTYIVNESCIKCKLMDCVESCPVDCFYEVETCWSFIPICRCGNLRAECRRRGGQNLSPGHEVAEPQFRIREAVA